MSMGGINSALFYLSTKKDYKKYKKELLEKKK